MYFVCMCQGGKPAGHKGERRAELVEVTGLEGKGVDGVLEMDEGVVYFHGVFSLRLTGQG